MGFRSNHIQIDGSLNVDGSIFQFQTEFTGGGGGGGGGDVGWANGAVGSNNYMITAAGDGSIVAESNITFNPAGFTLNVDGSVLIEKSNDKFFIVDTGPSPKIEIGDIDEAFGGNILEIPVNFDGSDLVYYNELTSPVFGSQYNNDDFWLSTNTDASFGKGLTLRLDASIGGKVYSDDGFETGNFEIVHNTTSDSLDFNYVG